jgi:hypothetical protein
VKLGETGLPLLFTPGARKPDVDAIQCLDMAMYMAIALAGIDGDGS